MKTAGQGDDLAGVRAPHFPHVAAGQLDGRLVGLRAGIAEKDLAMMAFGQQAAGQIQLRFLIEQIAHMPETPGLRHKGGRHLVVAVPEAGDGDTGQQIHIFPAVHVPQARPLAARDGDGVAAVGAAQQSLFLFLHLIKGMAHDKFLWYLKPSPSGRSAVPGNAATPWPPFPMTRMVRHSDAAVCASPHGRSVVRGVSEKRVHRKPRATRRYARNRPRRDPWRPDRLRAIAA